MTHTTLKYIKSLDLEQAEKKLIEEFEGTFGLPEDIKVSIPQTKMIDSKLAEKINNIYSKMKTNKCDWWIGIIGGEGTGKSTLAADILIEYCKTANKDFTSLLSKNVVFDEFEIIRMLAKSDPNTLYDFIWADEGANVFFNRDSNSSARKWSIKFSNAMRFKNYFMVICSVELKQLDTIIRDHRIKTLLRVPKQGIYEYYNFDQIHMLLEKNKGKRDMQFRWNLVEPELVGYFKHSQDIEDIILILKNNYWKRLQIEARQEYTYMLRKKLFKLNETKNKHKWKWT